MPEQKLVPFDSDIGWSMSHVGDVQLFYVDARITDSSFARYCDAMAREIDARPDDAQACVHYRLLGPQVMNAKRRGMVAEVLEPRREKLQRTTAAYAAVERSILGRGVLAALFWLSPPPYPHAIVGTSREAMAFLAKHRPDLDVQALLAIEGQEHAKFVRQRAAMQPTGRVG